MCNKILLTLVSRRKRFAYKVTTRCGPLSGTHTTRNLTTSVTGVKWPLRTHARTALPEHTKSKCHFERFPSDKKIPHYSQQDAFSNQSINLSHICYAISKSFSYFHYRKFFAIFIFKQTSVLFLNRCPCIMNFIQVSNLAYLALKISI